MFFRLMLWLLAKRIDSLSEQSLDFKNAIGRKKCVMQFKTADNRVKRYYAFAAGKTSSEGIVHKNPSITFSFKSAASARNLILKIAINPDDSSLFINAINLFLNK